MINIVRWQMNKIGAQEFLLPALHPSDIWKESGRWDTVDELMFRLKDRRNSELVLGLTHEEVFTSIARDYIKSYKQLPQIWYQIQTKFRDEPRPKSGLLRVREFTMKDSYSFDLSDADLDRSFSAHFQAYCEIFKQIELDYIPVEASSGDMGGSQSTEFMVATDSGEDRIALCKACSYAANLEKASGDSAETLSDGEERTFEEFATPGVRTIEDLVKFPGGAAAQSQIKTLACWLDDQFVLVILRGDHELNESKLLTCRQARSFRPAEVHEIVQALGATPGSLGAVGVRQETHPSVKAIIADQALQGRCNMVTGANRDNVHIRGVSLKRDIAVTSWADVRAVQAGDLCKRCGGPLEIIKSLEIGHIFKLGTRYSESMGACVLDASGKEMPILMGSYGIGIERAIAAVVETHHDSDGIVWPLALAPYTVLIVPTNMQDSLVAQTAEHLYEQMQQAGIEVLIDDRDERAGVKFKDADLIGIPYRLTIGKKVKEGLVELQTRQSRHQELIPIDEVTAKLISLVGGQQQLSAQLPIPVS